MLEIQKFLMNHNVADLELPPYSLKIGYYPDEDIYVFNYNQIESEKNQITKEARGLALYKGNNEWRVVRCGFTRFFNFGETGADEIDWQSATATQKEDGTLIFLFYWNNQWRVGTRSRLDASMANTSSSFHKTFMDLFKSVLAKYPNFDWNRLDKNCTYCVELCTRENKIVVDYEEPKLFHILTRNNSTLEEIETDIGLDKPCRYVLTGYDDYKELVESFTSNTEGIVVKDKYNRRVKMKTKLYFELHKTVNNHNINTAQVIDLIRSGEDAEFLCYFSEYTERFNKIRTTLTFIAHQINAVQEVVDTWKAHNPNATRKDFALFVQSLGLYKNSVGIFFSVYDGKSARQCYADMSGEKIIKVFNIKE